MTICINIRTFILHTLIYEYIHIVDKTGPKFTLSAGDGMNMNGGQVDRILRSALCSLVLVGERDVTTEVASIADWNDNLTSKYAIYRFDLILKNAFCQI